MQGRDTGLWYIKSATYGASDLLQQELVVVPGAGGTLIRIAVSNQTGALQGVVNPEWESVFVLGLPDSRRRERNSP